MNSIQEQINKLRQSLAEFMASGACSTFRADVQLEIEEKIAELENQLNKQTSEPIESPLQKTVRTAVETALEIHEARRREGWGQDEASFIKLVTGRVVISLEGPQDDGQSVT